MLMHFFLKVSNNILGRGEYFIWLPLLGEGPFSPIFLKIGDRLDAQVFLGLI